jgi:hypothetical protein
MRVLFLRADDLAASVRLLPLLRLLRERGTISHLCSVDRNMRATGNDGAPFDVVLAHRNPGTRQIAWLRRSRLPFVYDIDDLLLGGSASPGGRQAREQAAIRWCLANASTVTAPSRRLLAALERHLGEPLRERALYLPNAALEPTPPGPKAARPRILWVSSHGHHFAEIDHVATGLASAARALDTEVMLIGRFPDSVRARLPGHLHVAWVEPERYRDLLAAGSFIAAAPLPRALAPDRQEFIDCKSDIKAAEFGSLGIAALYSPAPPYSESDLPCVMARDNSAAAWETGMIALAGGYPQEGMKLMQHPAIAARRRERIGGELAGVLERARGAADRPVVFRSLPTPSMLRLFEQGMRSLRSRLLRSRTGVDGGRR